MDWFDNLTKLKKLSGKTIDEISVMSGIPLGTLNKLFAGQTKDPQLSTIKAVVHSLGFTLDHLMDIKDIVDVSSPDELYLRSLYRDFNDDGQRRVIEYAEDLKTSGRCKKGNDVAKKVV